MLSAASLGAHEHSQGKMISCSWTAGWRSLLLRGYDEPCSSNVTTAPTSDHTIVLVTAGEVSLNVHDGGRWRCAYYHPGCLGMTPPGREDHVRWQGGHGYSSLHLHLPASTIDAVRSQILPDVAAPLGLPNLCSHTDPTITSVMYALERGMGQGAPDLYAEMAAHFLVGHLLTQYPHPPLRGDHRWDLALRTADSFMRNHLSATISLTQLATVAGLGTFQLLRAAKLIWGETPLRRLTRLRMDRAANLLIQGNLPIALIAAECGYDYPAHFTTAFRRLMGVSPRAYREQSRR